MITGKIAGLGKSHTFCTVYCKDQLARTNEGVCSTGTGVGKAGYSVPSFTGPQQLPTANGI